MTRLLAIVVSLALAVPTAVAAQTPTKIRIRVVSHDAKIIGSGVGGARVYVRDPATGKVLAEGVQEGGTGDTRSIVVEPVARGSNVYDTPGAAQFTAELSLSEPTVLELVAVGPLDYEQAMQRSTKTMLLVPGQDVLGDGVLLELHGFVVELLEPDEVASGAVSVPLRARVRMMCGCPLEPGGLWDASRVEVKALVYAEGKLVQSVPLAYAGETSIFAGTLSLEEVPSGARFLVVASDPTRANFGRSEVLTVK